MYKEKFISLAQAVGKSEDAARVLPMLERNMKQFVDYVRAVYMLEVFPSRSLTPACSTAAKRLRRSRRRIGRGA